MSAITPHYRTVQQLLQGASFAIDEYQREYKWEKSNVDELLADLQAKFEADYKKGDSTQAISAYGEYFLGSIIVSQRSGKKYLVDGQQRITTLTLLLICLYRKADSKRLSIAQTIAPLIFSDNLGHPEFNLDIPERLPVIEALYGGLEFSVSGKDESIQTMFARYRDIFENDFIVELDDNLPHFIYWLMRRVGLIEIATDDDNHAYAIFETMNDRGRPLSPVDMLKAYLLAPITNTQARQNANRNWKHEVLTLISWGGVHEAERDANCIKAWLRAQYANTIRERKAGAIDKDWELIGSAFHRWIRDKSYELGLGTEKASLTMIDDNFRFFASAYRLILDASSRCQPGLEAVYYNACNDFTWQNTVLLAPLDTSDDVQTVRDKMAITAKYLDIWLMRRVVNYIRVGYSSVSYAMWGLCKDIRRKSVEELRHILVVRLNNDDVTFSGCNAKGRTGIEGLVLNQFTRRYIYHFLARLTAAADVASSRTIGFDQLMNRELFDIEHIWPDQYSAYSSEFASEQEFQEWRNHVASLLLIHSTVNRSLQHKDYVFKLPEYLKQNLFAASLHSDAYNSQPKFTQFNSSLGKPFQAHAVFDKAAQLDRRELIKTLAEHIWAPSNL